MGDDGARLPGHLPLDRADNIMAPAPSYSVWQSGPAPLSDTSEYSGLSARSAAQDSSRPTEDGGDDASDSESMSSYTESVYTDREAEQEVAGPGLGNNVLSWLHGRVHDASSALSRIAADMGPPVIYTPRDAAAEHHQRQQVRTVSRAAVRSGRIASIPWKELVGMKEAVLTQLEGAALVEERLEGSEHARQAEALRKGNMELEKGIAELQRLVDADAVETEAIAAGLRTQISQLRAELKAAADDQQAVEREHESRRRREGLKGEMGLMGEVARKQEAKLQAVRERLRGAQAAAAVQAATMSAEIATAEDAAQQAAAVASPSAAAAAAEGTAAAARLAEERLARLEATFEHRRLPPAMRPSTAVARWRRLQGGEPFERATPPAGGSAADAAPLLSGFAWVSVSADLRRLEVRPLAAKDAPPSSVLRVRELIRIDVGVRPLTLRLHTLSGAAAGADALCLHCTDASQLAFWHGGLQELGTIATAERLSCGGVLWRVARELYRVHRQQGLPTSA